PSHVGELYWNYGWGGVTIGMALIGALLGFVGAKCSLAERVSVTRLLVLLATVQYLCVGAEGVMQVSYICWVRSVAAILLLQLLLARRASPAAPTPAAGRISNAPQLALPRFPNLMR